ncbi:MAG: hypothetical protein P8Y36_02790, partial [Alphaproteobacteria bacterium]
CTSPGYRFIVGKNRNALLFVERSSQVVQPKSMGGILSGVCQLYKKRSAEIDHWSNGCIRERQMQRRND